MHTDAVRVAVIESDAPIRSILQRHAAKDPTIEFVAVAGNSEQGFAKVSAVQPDVILLDISLPGHDGVAMIPELRARAPDARIVMYSADEVRRLEALEAGADAWCTKGDGWDNIVATIADQLPSRWVPASPSTGESSSETGHLRAG